VSSSKPDWISRATQQIKSDEGEVLHAYKDHLGFLTIGVGRLIDTRKNGGITKEESAYLLNNDIVSRVETLEKVLPWFKDLSGPRKAVLLSMSFQMGVAGLLEFKTTLSHIKNGDYVSAKESMLNSLWADQTPARAKRLAMQMRTDKWQSG
jgi:lysozyme